MAEQTYIDPLEKIDEPYVPPAFELWGLVSLNAWYAALVKGEGKVPFDPAVHKSRVTAIDISVVPVTEQDAQVITRNMIRESREWGLVQVSLQECGCPKAAEANGKYAHVLLEHTGETYTNNQGEVKNKTYIKFVKIFTDEQACVADYKAGQGVEAPSGTAAPMDKEYETSFRFLKSACQNFVRGETDIEKIKTKAAPVIAKMPMINKFFTVDSPEFLQACTEAMAK